MEDQWVRQLEARVDRALEALAGGAAPILLAVSGGPDSVCLAAASVAVAARGGRARALALATVDHQLRPESLGEVELVGRLARIWRVPHFSRRVTIAPGPALEARARAARYEALESMRRDLAEDAFVATAHTRDDQAETVLMRLGRGAALRGAAGVRPRRGRVLRPLLFASRDDVRRYLRLRGVPFVHDAMNDDLRFTRVGVRALVLPALRRALGPGVTAALARFAELARADDDLLQTFAASAVDRLVSAAGVERVGLVALEPPIARRVVARWLAALGVSVDADGVERCLQTATTGSAQPLAGDRLVRVVRGRLTLVAAPPRLQR